MRLAVAPVLIASSSRSVVGWTRLAPTVFHCTRGKTDTFLILALTDSRNYCSKRISLPSAQNKSYLMDTAQTQLIRASSAWEGLVRNLSVCLALWPTSPISQAESPPRNQWLDLSSSFLCGMDKLVDHSIGTFRDILYGAPSARAVEIHQLEERNVQNLAGDMNQCRQGNKTLQYELAVFLRATQQYETGRAG